MVFSSNWNLELFERRNVVKRFLEISFGFNSQLFVTLTLTANSYSKR